MLLVPLCSALTLAYVVHRFLQILELYLRIIYRHRPFTSNKGQFSIIKWLSGSVHDCRLSLTSMGLCSPRALFEGPSNGLKEIWNGASYLSGVFSWS